MITASIVTFHTSHTDLNRLLDCVIKSPIEILFIVDNSSNDELRNFVGDNIHICYIHSLNVGYGEGHNIAIKRAIELGANYHVVINPDIYWNDKVIDSLCKFMNAQPNVGLVMPKILYPSGELQYLCKLLPTPMDLIFRRFIPIKSFQNRRNYYYELRWADYNQVMEIPSLSGCFMFMRCSILKSVGGFDERYFMYAEDLDLCRRIGEISKTMFYPMVTVVHEYKKGSYKNKKLLKYHIISVIKYFNKWGWLFDSKRKNKNNTCIKSIQFCKQSKNGY